MCDTYTVLLIVQKDEKSIISPRIVQILMVAIKRVKKT